MAVTNEQVLAEVSEYRAANSRPCPANHLTAKFGDEVLDIIKSLKTDGTLIGKRGRTGGLIPADAATVAETPVEGEGESVADQFAALAAKLAADEPVSADVVNG
jgi:hypothetical protein